MAILPDQYPLLIAAPMLQDYLVDKDTGAPLSGGFVTFYHDNARTILKNVYYQTGVPGAYTYIPLPNPNQLTSVGTIADNGGNDVIPYYFPYDEDDSTISDPYYVTVYNANENNTPGVLQWTRENFPFISNDGGNNDVGQQDVPNLISNGQFTAHTNLPNGGLFPGSTAAITVAQGGSIGWTYNRLSISTDTDTATFNQILQEPPGLVGNPRFAIDLACTATTNSSPYKTLAYQFNNVNRFASMTQYYTLSFAGISNLASPLTVTFNLYKYFGSGGSTPVTIEEQQFTLLPGTWSQFSFSFIFGTNQAYTIGANNDDYSQIQIMMPGNTLFNISLTDFILTPGIVDFNQYPERPDNDVFATALTGSLPTPDPGGSDYYIPIVVTPAGANYGSTGGGGTGGVGQIVIYPFAATGPFLLCNGGNYLTSAYSTLGVPYSRLQSLLMAQGPGGVIPLYGTGRSFATVFILKSSTATVLLYTNLSGAQTVTSDGTAATGFTFANVFIGQAFYFYGRSDGNANVLVRTALLFTSGVYTAPLAQTSGFTITLLTSATSTNIYQSFTIQTIAASGISPGSYFTFSDSGNNPNYMWFTINGSGVDPAPGGTGYQVNLLSTYTAIDVAAVVQQAIASNQVSSIVCKAASTLTAGDYFNFYANAVRYVVYYTIAGVGAAPSVGTPIVVALTGTETAAQVATKTQVAINSYYFAVPDFRGRFLAGVGSAIFDTHSASRYSPLPNYYGNVVGTDESSAVYSAGATFANAGINFYIQY